VDGTEGTGEVAGVTYIHTADGQRLNRISKGVYQTRLGETFRSDDPAAP
jgi:hypothetical protein